MKKIGIMGGTFDPIHVGHLMLAEEAMTQKGFEEVWFIPTGCSYMKKDRDVVSPEERLEMVRLAIADNDRMKCLDIETRRTGYTYSYETFEYLKDLYPEYDFYFIFGDDCLFNIENWKYPERIFKAVKILAATRNDSDLKKMEMKGRELAEKYSAHIEFLNFPNIEISSTDIRDRISKGKSIRYLVPDACLEYIIEKRLYQNEK